MNLRRFLTVSASFLTLWMVAGYFTDITDAGYAIGAANGTDLAESNETTLQEVVFVSVK